MRKAVDSRMCCHKSLKLAEKRYELPKTIEVEKTSTESMETNIDPHLQEDESIASQSKS